ncbi:hypothetical protein LNV08_22010 [Paucibacter sp. TC2R-5]|uniref:hypothetical protein n=1 Tax=Paucibacter sp. TC2R-5 TaxID=2893555 RepID=UPI0021E4DA5F|nr:hypothetical protein [Paucibacter sp. TC2R-5]MCV2361649.1 hypothetical protein [Paucibacter sp. TC2R-5]
MPPDQEIQDKQPADLGADLGGLLLQAEAIEGANAPPDPTQQQAAQVAAVVESTAAELQSALELVRMMAAPLMSWWPEFGTVWNDRTLQEISAGGAAVMERHGWTVGDAFSKFGPYIALAGATLPPALVTYQAIKLNSAEQRRQQQPQRRQAPQHEDAEGVRP